MRWQLFTATLIQLLQAIVIWGARRRVHRRMEGHFTSKSLIDIGLGTPPRFTTLSMEIIFDEFIIVDYDCQYPKRAMQCPRFCTDETLRRTFCRSLCQQPSKSKPCTDPEPRQVSVTNSTSFRDLGEDVSLTFKGHRPFFAQLSADNFEFTTFQYNKSSRMYRVSEVPPKRTVVELRDQPFIRGMSAAVRVINGYAGILGLRPGQQSFVPRLKAGGLLDSAIISIQRDTRITYSTSFRRSYSTVMFGVLDKSVCVWKRLPAHNLQGWAFEISDVKFLDTQLRGKSVARLTLDALHTQIPQHLAAKYVEAGLLRYSKDEVGRKDTRSLEISPENRTLLNLEFKIGDELVEFSWEMLMWYPQSTYTLLYPGDETRYADEAEWVFGTRALDHFCFGYDYDSNEVAWGRRRRLLGKG